MGARSHQRIISEFVSLQPGPSYRTPKMHSEFPFQKRPSKHFKYDPDSSDFPEVIEEDKAEAEY